MSTVLENLNWNKEFKSTLTNMKFLTANSIVLEMLIVYTDVNIKNMNYNMIWKTIWLMKQENVTKDLEDVPKIVKELVK